MSNTLNAHIESHQPMIYHVRIKGHLGRQWTEWFEGMTITPEENGDTLLTGPVVDQAALYGLLRKVRDVGMPLLSVNPFEPSRCGTAALEEGHESNRLDERPTTRCASAQRSGKTDSQGQ
jgi:hypothetical protein